jgi:hypothetical protein
MAFPDDLPESVRQLARVRLTLRSERESRDEEFLGIWGGSGAVPPPAELNHAGPRHWLSVDCRWLEENEFGVRGCLSVYRAGGDFVVLNDPDLAFEDSPANGLALFGREELSWPEEEALSAYLPAAEVRALFASDLGVEYLRWAQQTNPLYNGGAAAVLGGWHMSWPDGPPELPRLRELNERIHAAGGPGVMPCGEAYRCEPYRLLLWTLRDAEPWVEVWGGGEGELHAVARIT